MSVPLRSGVLLGPTGTKLYRIVQLLVGDASGFYITSAYRPTDTSSHHGGLTYGGSPTAAIDVGFGYGTSGYQARARFIASKIYAMPNDVVELIVSGVGSPYSYGGYYIKNQQRVNGYAVADHYNHVHFATSSAFADRILARLESSDRLFDDLDLVG